MQVKIEILKKELADGNTKIAKDETEIGELEDQIQEKDKYLAGMNDELDDLTQVYQKEKDEPARLEKTNTNIQKSVAHMEKEKQKVTD